MGMNTRTLLTVLAVVAVAFVATNCLAATVDANKPGDANKPAEPNKVTVISASDFGTYAAEVNIPADANKPAEPNKSKMCAVELAKDVNSCEPNKPADANDKK